VRSEVAKQLREDGSKLNELAGRKIAAEDQLWKLILRAAGQHGLQLAVDGVGGVVGAGEPITRLIYRATISSLSRRASKKMFEKVVAPQSNIRDLNTEPPPCSICRAPFAFVRVAQNLKWD
jgi:HlyD family secretion protein